MRRAARTLLAAAGAALVLVACQSDPVSGPSRIVGEPLLDMDFGPAGNSVFPSFSAQRITAATAKDTIEFTVNALPPTGTGNTYQIVLVDTATGSVAADSLRIIREVRSRWPVDS